MATLDEIRQLGGDFIQNIQKLQTANAIGEASDAASKITQQVTEEGERRQQLTQVGNALALRLGQLGAPVSQIESAFKSIAPKMPGSMAEAILLGDQSGVKAYQKEEEFKTQQKIAAGEPSITATKQEGALDRASKEKIALGTLSLNERQEKIKQSIALKQASIKGTEILPDSFPTENDKKLMQKTLIDARKTAVPLNELISRVKKHGIETIGKNAQLMESLATQVKLHLKGESNFNLGVLSGPDLDLLNTVVNDPTSFLNSLKFINGKSQVVGSLTNLSRILNKGLKGTSEVYGYKTSGIFDERGAPNLPGVGKLTISDVRDKLDPKSFLE